MGAAPCKMLESFFPRVNQTQFHPKKSIQWANPQVEQCTVHPPSPKLLVVWGRRSHIVSNYICVCAPIINDIYMHTYIYIYHRHWTQCNITSHPPRSLADSRFLRLGSHSRVLSTAPARTSWSITELFHAYNLDMFFLQTHPYAGYKPPHSHRMSVV